MRNMQVEVEEIDDIEFLEYMWYKSQQDIAEAKYGQN